MVRDIQLVFIQRQSFLVERQRKRKTWERYSGGGGGDPKIFLNIVILNFWHRHENSRNTSLALKKVKSYEVTCFMSKVKHGSTARGRNCSTVLAPEGFSRGTF
jgi:hypothetical protein